MSGVLGPTAIAIRWEFIWKMKTWRYECARSMRNTQPNPRCGVNSLNEASAINHLGKTELGAFGGECYSVAAIDLIAE